MFLKMCFLIAKLKRIIKLKQKKMNEKSQAISFQSIEEKNLMKILPTVCVHVKSLQSCLFVTLCS